MAMRCSITARHLRLLRVARTQEAWLSTREESQSLRIYYSRITRSLLVPCQIEHILALAHATSHQDPAITSIAEANLQRSLHRTSSLRMAVAQRRSRSCTKSKYVTSILTLKCQLSHSTLLSSSKISTKIDSKMINYV